MKEEKDTMDFLKRIYTHIPFAIKTLYWIRNTPEYVFDQYHMNVGYSNGDKEKIVKDMKLCLWLYGMHYDEYIWYDLYKKPNEYKKSFISQCNRFKYYNKLNSRKNKILYTNKYKTYKLFKQFYRHEIIKLEEKEDFQEYINFIKQNSKFVVKPYNLSCGVGVNIYDTANLSDEEINKIFDEAISSGISICEEYILQSNEMASFNRTSVNTLRISTVLTGRKPEEYRVRILAAVLRIGRSGSMVDNAGAGGIVAQINLSTGKLNKFGRDQSGNTYEVHPDSKVRFEGFVIPDWHKVQELVRELALVVPSNRYTGWDLALTKSGWDMIEANSEGAFFVLQLSDRVGKKRKLDNLCRLI